jgi:signal transduction histidine kinase
MMLHQFFQVNEPVVFFIYGLAFFTLGLSVTLQTRKYSRLEMARHLPWLALFGITHGLTEWGYLFIPIQSRYLGPLVIEWLDVLQLCLMALSFAALFQFGLNLVLPEDCPRHWRWAPTVLLLVMWLVVLFVNNFIEPFTPAHLRITGEIWIRVLLGFPGSLLSAIGFLRQSRRVRDMDMPHIATYMTRVAELFVAYALLSGLITPPHDILWTRWLHDRSFDNILGIPIPFFRSLIGIGLTYFIRLSQEVFVVETDRQLESAERQKYEIADRDRKILNAVALTVTRPLDLDEILEDALNCVLAELGLPAGWINLFDQRETLRTACSQNLRPSAGALTCRRKGARCLCWHVMETQRASPPTGHCHCLEVPVMQDGEEYLHHSASIPLIARDKPLGTLNLMSSAEHVFAEEEWGLLTAIGRQIGVAIENVRLYKELHRKDALRGRLLDKVITAQEEERRRIARELHDQLGQDIGGLSMTIGAAITALPGDPGRAAAILEDTSEIVSSMLGTLRSLILDLRPAALDDLGLIQALRRYCGYLSHRSGLEITVSAHGFHGRLPPQVETTVFRIAQEALANAALHSEASHAYVDIQCSDSLLRATVSDDGHGFSLGEVLPPDETGRGWGLVGMQERAALFGGRVEIQSRPNAGTEVTVYIPLDGDGQGQKR